MHFCAGCLGMSRQEGSGWWQEERERRQENQERWQEEREPWQEDSWHIVLELWQSCGEERDDGVVFLSPHSHLECCFPQFRDIVTLPFWGHSVTFQL